MLYLQDEQCEFGKHYQLYVQVIPRRVRCFTYFADVPAGVGCLPAFLGSSDLGGVAENPDSTSEKEKELGKNMQPRTYMLDQIFLSISDIPFCLHHSSTPFCAH